MSLNKNQRSNAPRVTIFKEVFSRHKRKGKDPNRIEDLFSDGDSSTTTISTLPNAEGVIDVVRVGKFRAHKRRKRKRAGSSESLTQTSLNGEDRITDAANGDAAKCFGHDLVFPVESKLCFLDVDSSNRSATSVGYGFYEFPGVYLYPGVLGRDLQLELAYRAVTEYCELSVHSDNAFGDSHRTNIDLLPPKPNELVNQIGKVEQHMWTLWKREREPAHPINRLGGDNGKGSAETKPKQKKNCKNNNNNNNNSNSNSNSNSKNFYRRFAKLSWATMGYHYDWTERSYHPKKKSTMPELVARLSTLFATAQPSRGIEDSGSNEMEEEPSPNRAETSVSSFTPSASIVNYYTTKSTMGGHRDDLEDTKAMDKPIVSISLGLPGIFILGGPDKEEYAVEDEHRNPSSSSSEDLLANNPAKTKGPHPVRAILLRPGDVLIMGGASRLNYHAMARVLPHEAAIVYERTLLSLDGIGYAGYGSHDGKPGSIVLQDLFSDEVDGGGENSDGGAPRSETVSRLQLNEEEESEFLNEYLRNHRININVRQVYPDNDEKPQPL